MKRRLTRVALLAALSLGFTHFAYAQSVPAHEPSRTISVAGEGIYRVSPDMAVVTFGVVTRAAAPEEARRLNAEAAAAALNAVRALGVEERHIRLQTLQLQPWREYDQDQRRFVERGFEAVREMVVEVRDLEQLPVLIAEIIDRGANRLNGIRYELQEKEAARNEALRRAAENARDKARLLATTLDVGLGPVRMISEQSFSFPVPVMHVARAESIMAKDAAAPEPEAYAAGEIEVTATVQVVFAIE